MYNLLLSNMANINTHVTQYQQTIICGGVGGAGLFAYMPPPPIEPVRTREHFLTVLGRHICPLSRYEEEWEQFLRDCPNHENNQSIEPHINVVYIETQRRPVVREIGRILGFFRGTWEREQDLRDVVEPIFMNYMAHYNISPEEADILEELADQFIPPEYRLGDNHWEWEDDGGDGNEPAEMAVPEE